MGYNFTATAFPTAQSPFGHVAATFNPVAGSLVYDTDAPGAATPGCASCTTYYQNYPGGLAGTFNSLSISADEYVVIISNDLLQPGGSLADIVNIRWVTNLTPALGPATANGATQTSGIFSLNLLGPSGLFSDSSLPASLNLANFTSRLSFLADTPSGGIDVVFNVATLTAFTPEPRAIQTPEPAGWMLLLIGAAALGGQQLLRGRRANANAIS